jgi:hypothetical protein
MTLTAATLRNDKKCGASAIAATKTCRIGSGAAGQLTASRPRAPRGRLARRVAAGALAVGIGAGITAGALRYTRGRPMPVPGGPRTVPVSKTVRIAGKAAQSRIEASIARRKAASSMQKTMQSARETSTDVNTAIRKTFEAAKKTERHWARSARLHTERLRRKHEPGYRKPRFDAEGLTAGALLQLREDKKCGNSGIRASAVCTKPTARLSVKEQKKRRKTRRALVQAAGLSALAAGLVIANSRIRAQYTRSSGLTMRRPIDLTNPEVRSSQENAIARVREQPSDFFRGYDQPQTPTPRSSSRPRWVSLNETDRKIKAAYLKRPRVRQRKSSIPDNDVSAAWKGFGTRGDALTPYTLLSLGKP